MHHCVRQCFPFSSSHTIPALPAEEDWLSKPGSGSQQWVRWGQLENRQDSDSRRPLLGNAGVRTCWATAEVRSASHRWVELLLFHRQTLCSLTVAVMDKLHVWFSVCEDANPLFFSFINLHYWIECFVCHVFEQRMEQHRGQALWYTCVFDAALLSFHKCFCAEDVVESDWAILMSVAKKYEELYDQLLTENSCCLSPNLSYTALNLTTSPTLCFMSMIISEHVYYQVAASDAHWFICSTSVQQFY